jgi:hypothetical protein
MVPHNRQAHLPISQELADRLAHHIVKTVVRVRRGRWVCWESTRCVNRVTGYANVGATINGRFRQFYRHRVMYVHYFGEFPTELTIDHLCENPTCCNPKHLRPATHAENVLRSRKNPFALHAQQIECSNGHPLPERTLTESASRKCVQCARARNARLTPRRSGRTLPDGDPRHGTQAGYNYWACKCDACRAWQHANYLSQKAAA